MAQVLLDAVAASDLASGDEIIAIGIRQIVHAAWAGNRFTYTDAA